MPLHSVLHPATKYKEIITKLGEELTARATKEVVGHDYHDHLVRRCDDHQPSTPMKKLTSMCAAAAEVFSVLKACTTFA